MFTQVRMIVAGCVIAAILALGSYVYFTRKSLREARARVVTAEQGTTLAEATTQVVERVVRSEVTIRTQAEEAVDVVQAAKGADAPVDDELRARICAAVTGMRDGAPACNDQPAGKLNTP